MRMKSVVIASRRLIWAMLLLLSTSLSASQEDGAGADGAAQPEEDPALAIQRQETLERAQALQAQIEGLSHELGSYDPALIELQDDLGRTYLELEEFELAHGTLEQAMQLVRVNDGLYGERQVSLLKSLVQANLGLQAWEQVDIYAHLLFDLQSRAHEPDSEAYVAALVSFSDWQLQASRYNLLTRPGSQQGLQALQDLQDRHERALASARDRGDVEQQWSLLYAMASTDAEVARQFNYQQLSEFNSPTPRYVSQTVCRTVPN
ncbi:MAG: hypothetical protein WD600_06495, partial [Pseudohongiella sp.]